MHYLRKIIPAKNKWYQLSSMLSVVVPNHIAMLSMQTPLSKRRDTSDISS